MLLKILIYNVDNLVVFRTGSIKVEREKFGFIFFVLEIFKIRVILLLIKFEKLIRLKD